MAIIQQIKLKETNWGDEANSLNTNFEQLNLNKAEVGQEITPELKDSEKPSTDLKTYKYTNPQGIEETYTFKLGQTVIFQDDRGRSLYAFRGLDGDSAIWERVNDNGDAETTKKLFTAINLSLVGEIIGTVKTDLSKNVSISTTLQPIDASKITSGVLDIDRIPKGAIERLIVVPNKAARFALTPEEVQNGDTVKEVDTKLMYYVVDNTKLSTEEGYEVYQAGRAASCPWSGIEGKPDKFPPSAHTHVIDDVTDINSGWDDLLKAAPTSQVTRDPSWSEISDKPEAFPPEFSLNINWNSILSNIRAGFYSGGDGSPLDGIISNAVTTGFSLSYQRSSSGVALYAVQVSARNNRIWFRTKENGTVGSWLECYHTGNKPKWEDIIDKPNTFKPELTPNVDWNDIILNTGNWGFFSGITNSPYSQLVAIGFSLVDSSKNGIQLVANGNRISFRTRDTNALGTWNEFFHTNNRPKWIDILSKPTTIEGYGIQEDFEQQVSDLIGSNAIGFSGKIIAGDWDLGKIGYGVTSDGWKTNGPAASWGNSDTQGKYVLQIQMDNTDRSVWIRNISGNTVSAWKQFVFLGSDGKVPVSLMPKLDYLPLSDLNTSWINLLKVAPAAQVTRWASWSEVTGKPSAFNSTWELVSGKPTAFTPAAHNQAWDTITSTPTTLAGYSITDAFTKTQALDAVKAGENITITKSGETITINSSGGGGILNCAWLHILTGGNGTLTDSQLLEWKSAYTKGITAVKDADGLLASVTFMSQNIASVALNLQVGAGDIGVFGSYIIVDDTSKAFTVTSSQLTLTASGTGNKYLADNGQYKSISTNWVDIDSVEGGNEFNILKSTTTNESLFFNYQKKGGGAISIKYLYLSNGTASSDTSSGLVSVFTGILRVYPNTNQEGQSSHNEGIRVYNAPNGYSGIWLGCTDILGASENMWGISKINNGDLYVDRAGTETMDGFIVKKSGGGIYCPGGFFKESDKRVKSNIEELQFTLEDISKIPTVTFDMHGKRQMGTIAQDIESICPLIVNDVLVNTQSLPEREDWELEDVGEETYAKVKGVEYPMVGVISLHGVKLLAQENKELKQEVNSLKLEIKELQEKLNIILNRIGG